jgi:uncharacterized membrane protein YhhN
VAEAPVLIGLGAVAVVALVAAERADHAVGRAVAKLVASTAFVAQGLACGGGWDLMTALVLSWIGDACLLSRDRRWFFAGLGAFLLAHVAFAVTFARMGPSWTVAAVVAVPVVGAGWGVAAGVRKRAGALAVPVLAYATAIGAMVATAAGVAAEPTPARIGVLVGAVLFWASDLCVARDRFVAPGFGNRAVGLPLYYAAQLLLATVLPA